MVRMADEQREEARTVLVVGPDGQPLGSVAVDDKREDDSDDPARLIEQPAKVMRIANMIKQLLEEVRAAPLDDAGRQRLKEIHRRSIIELEDGLAPELRDELERIVLPYCSTASRRPSWRSRWRPAPSSNTCAADRPCPAAPVDAACPAFPASRRSPARATAPGSTSRTRRSSPARRLPRRPRCWP
jgi:hypothetical protein